MTSFRIGEETRADQELYTTARMVDVACGTCRATARVKKNSDQHTSIQWSVEGLAACQEFAVSASRPGGRAVYEPCSKLSLAIADAVEGGQIEIGATDGY